MHCHAELRLSSPGQLKAARRRYKTFMIDEILSKETCDYFEKLSLYSVCPSLIVRPKPLHSCTGKTCGRGDGWGAVALTGVGRLPTRGRENGPGSALPCHCMGPDSSAAIFAEASAAWEGAGQDVDRQIGKEGKAAHPTRGPREPEDPSFFPAPQRFSESSIP